MELSILDKLYRDKIFNLDETESRNSEHHEVNFGHLCQGKTLEKEFSADELISKNKFVSIVEKINSKHPFLFLPFFIKDFMNGKSLRQLIQKHHLRNTSEFQYMQKNILKLEGKRLKGNDNEVLNKNLDNKSFKSTYDLIINNSAIFENELYEILNYNLLRAFCIIVLYNSNETTIEEITENLEKTIQENKGRIELLSDTKILESFSKYRNIDLVKKTKSIIDGLIAKDLLQKDLHGRVSLDQKLVKINDTILSILSKNPNGIYFDSFHRRLLNEIPILKLVPKIGIWESALEELEITKVKRLKTFWRYSPYRDTLFLSQDFDKQNEQVQKQIISSGGTKFFGRKISPDRFISELAELEKGDLDDIDDQVTRIAGLVLADSATLKAPYEDMEEFDFAVDISDYQIKPDKIEVMKRINFSLVGSIIHCKLMINEGITPDLIKGLERKMADGHQGVIFTLESIKNKDELVPANKKIQIVDRDGILAWSQTTSTIPCRLGAVAKIMYGDYRGKIVRINGVNYESRFATVQEIFDGTELSVYVGCLQEISITDHNLDFPEASENYYKFLKFLADNSEGKEAFEEAIFDSNMDKVRCIQCNSSGKEINSCDVDDKMTIAQIPFYKNLYDSKTKRIVWEMKRGYVTSQIRYVLNGTSPKLQPIKSYDSCKAQLQDMINCNCVFFEEQGHSYRLCGHIIKSLDLLAKILGVFAKNWNDRDLNIINEFLLQFKLLKGFSIIEYVRGWLPPDDAIDMMAYVKKLASNDIDDRLAGLREQWIDRFGTEFTDALLRMEKVVHEMDEDDIKTAIRILG